MSYTTDLSRSLHSLFNEAARTYVATEDNQMRLTAAKKRHLKEQLTNLSKSLFVKASSLSSIVKPVEPLDERLAELIQQKQINIQNKMNRLAEKKNEKLKQLKAIKESDITLPSSSAQPLGPYSLVMGPDELARLEALKATIMDLASNSNIRQLRSESELLSQLVAHLGGLRGSERPELDRVLANIETPSAMKGKAAAANEPGKTRKKMSVALASRLAASPY